MKKHLLTLLAILMTISSFANPIDEATAKRYAENFWKENRIMGVRNGKVFKKKADEARFVNIATRGGYSEFYIFNNEIGKGFVIVSADDCVTPILGYSYDNNFVVENMPDNVKGWMDGYAEQIRYAVNARLAATDEIREEWNCLRQSTHLPIKSERTVNPMIVTHWAQSPYYNDKCPYDYNHNQRALTGCGATAMAQIMKYWSHPEHGIGSHSYLPENHPEYGTQYADFAGTYYQWNSMPNELTGPNDATSTLMYHCGVAVNMDYGLGNPYDGGSNSYLYGNNSLENAFRTYFDYKSTITHIIKENYSNNQWISNLKDELNNGRPILYRGANSLNQSGHFFIFDGYNNSNAFHINWGWGSQYDGNYYFIDNLCNGGDYSYYQMALIGIEPDNTYEISATANPTIGGNVSGAGNYEPGQTCTLTASANTGYTFSNWTENGSQVSTNASYSFAVTGNRNLVANFTQNTYTVTASANPSNGGTASGSGTYNYGQTCTLTASANNGYSFSNWTENGSQVSTNPSYSFTVNGNRNLVANFTLNSYSVNVSVNPSTGGTTSGSGAYNYGQTCTLTASANTGYSFSNWTENGSQVSTNPSYSFTVNSNRNLVANFTLNSYSVNASANPSTGGTTSGSGAYNYGQTCTLTASANTGYSFSNWTENGSQVSTNASYSFTVNGNRNLVANFTLNSYSVNASANPSTGGTTSGSGAYNYGQTCTLTTSANTGYTFSNWTENGNQVSTNASFSFTVTGNRNLVANFVPNTHTVTASANPTNGGTVSGSGTYNYGQNCTVAASPANGYAFTNWTENDTQVSTNATYSFTVDGNRNLVANFAQNVHTITATAGANGAINPSGAVSVAQGENKTFEMTPNSGYEVFEVYVDGNLIGSMSSFTFNNVVSDHSIFVTFQHVDGVEENTDNEIVFYPNPSNGVLNVQCAGMDEIRIYNVYGVLVSKAATNGNELIQIDLGKVSSGIYLLQAIQNDESVSKVFIKE